jgi:hypothetical protein
LLDLQRQSCSGCHSALYCSEACHRKGWRKQHKQICKLLNVGHGGMQVRSEKHVRRSPYLKEIFEKGERSLKEDVKRLLLVRSSDSEVFSWPNSRLLVMLQLVDTNVMSGCGHEVLQEGESSESPLHHLADLADPSDYSSHESRLILAKELTEYGTNVNAVSITHGKMSLRIA